jgi:SAM-dependent methyltransferase
MQPHADAVVVRGPLPVWVLALLVHALSVPASLWLAAQMPALLPGGAWCWLEGAVAAVLGVVARLPRWWLPLNLLFVPGAYTLLEWQIPAVLYLVLFLLLLAVNGSAWRHRVPLFLSSTRATAVVAGLLPQRAGMRFLDLGCGNGSLLADLALARPDGSFDGIEAAPLCLLLSRWRTRRQAAVNVIWGDFWDADLAQYDVVYAYLSPAPMSRLWHKARREMKAGSLLISNSFPVSGVAPDRTLASGDRMRSMLFVWRM